MLSGRRPVDLGVRDGRFKPCPATPNCVSSQSDPAVDAGHHVEPMALRGSAHSVWSALLEILRHWPRVNLVLERPGYVHAECRSRIFGFVDDLELWLDEPAGLIHVRSASRLGRRDFGVNRRRVQTLRSRLQQRLAQR
jgi:uncharacterized protein (DUF1499 family)